MGLTLQELFDWPTEIGNLASATHDAAATHNRSAEFYRSLASASTWEGAAGATAQQAMVASAGDHEDAADRIGNAATAMDHAEKDSEALAADVKAILNDAAAAPAVQVNTATNQVIPPDTSYLTEVAAAQVAAKVADLQSRIAAVLARGAAVDAELAQAISSATGVPAAKVPQAVAAQPARPAPPQPNSLDEALGQLVGGSGPLPAPQPRPTMDPAEAERAKAALRQVMVNDGVPPDQIEARVNDLMAKANQPLPPSYRPPEVKGPEPGFGDGFADTWFGTEQQIRNLVGQGGPGEPGIGEAWGDLLKGTAEQFSGPFGPLNPAVNEVKAALNSPNAAYYLGQKSAEGAMTAPTLMFGGEGALARAGLDLPEGAPNDLVHPPQVSDSVVPQGHTPSLGAPLHQAPDLVPQPLPAHSPMFDGYHAVDPGPQFTHADGDLIYPDDSLPSRPYAIEGTIVPHAELPAGTALDRFGYPGGEWLSPEGTPFAERALPPASAGKPYFEYVVADASKLPPGWRIEQSNVAPWFNQPGGGVQYRIVAPDGIDASVTELLESGYLKTKGG